MCIHLCIHMCTPTHTHMSIYILDSISVKMEIFTFIKTELIKALTLQFLLQIPVMNSDFAG